MYQKVRQLLELLTARTKKIMSIDERRPTVLFQLMSAIDVQCGSAPKERGADKYDGLAELLSTHFDKDNTYLSMYGIKRGPDAEYTSEEVGESISYAKQGNDRDFILALLHCMWNNPSKFTFLKNKLTDPNDYDDEAGAMVWAALAYADLYANFISKPATPRSILQTGRSDGLVRIEDDFQIAQQRIAYSLDTGSGHVSFADLHIEFLPEELDQVDFMYSLDLRNTKIKSLPNLSKFKKLKTLNCSYMEISDIRFVDGCESLENFFIGKSDVDSLEGIEGAPNIKGFYCGSTFVTDISPLGKCRRLEHVSCESTYINSLKGLENSPNLHTVDCGMTQIKSLSPLESANKLKRVVLSGCHIDHNSKTIWTKRSLKEVTLFNGSLGTVPPEILSKNARDNCQHRLLEYFSINDELVEFRASKVFILGNGGIGKTQLAGLLINRDFAPDSLSTHGVDVHSLSLPLKGSNASADTETLQIWDFGGQELYHGIHALFLRRRIIYILAWSPRHEMGWYDDLHGGVFKNYPVSYWQSFIRSGGSSTSPLIAVETKIDERRDIGSSETRIVIDGFYWTRELRISAREDREVHRAALLNAIEEASAELSSRGPTKIPRRWLNVIDEVVALRKGAVTGVGPKFSVTAADQKIVITKGQFGDICRKQGIEDGDDVLLEFMDSIGEVIYRPGFNDNMIVVDQNAAFFAVYKAANRGAFLSFLKGNDGRFTVKELAATSGETIAGTVPLLDLMLSFGTCFETYRINGDATYIAPSGLPSSPSMKTINDSWEVIRGIYEYNFLHDGFFHSLISRIGIKLRADADYWTDGVYYNDEDNLCSFRLRREKREGVSGSIIVEAQHPKGSDPATARRYLSDIDAIIEVQEFDSGITPASKPAIRQSRNSARQESRPILIAREPALETGDSTAGIIKEAIKIMHGGTIANIEAIERAMGYASGGKSRDQRALYLVTESLHDNALGKLHQVIRDTA